MLYIGKERCSMKSQIKRDKIDYSYDIIDIRDIPCESFLYSNDSSAIVLAMLCDFEGKDKQTVVNTIKSYWSTHLLFSVILRSGSSINLRKRVTYFVELMESSSDSRSNFSKSIVIM